MSRAAAVMLLALACFGCGEKAPGGRSAKSTPPVKVIQDRRPIEKLFPRLGRFSAVYWTEKTPQAGRLAPGPSVYTIEAVVVLRPADAKGLRRDYKWNLAPAPTVAPELAAHLGAAPLNKRWLVSEDFEEALAEDAPRITEIWMHFPSHTVFVRSHTT
jgi:hypothetical protein